MSEQVAAIGRTRNLATRIDRLVLSFSRHWLLVFSILLGLYVGLPFLAPIFMQVGWTGAAGVIYTLYSTQCHQLPQRSFFLFGSKPMYSLVEIQAVWGDSNNPMVLRQFIGDTAMGWKVAWSDRMVSMYGAVLLFALLWGVLQRRVKPLPWWGLGLLLLPMAADGVSHFVSDLFGIGHGFRDSNEWLARLTGHSLPPAFYAGDSLGSLNSWLRLLTGLLFGLGVVWFGFPYLARGLADVRDQFEAKLRRAGDIG